ncbi:hypothetical protein Bca52824_014524 [Brassica carinata]|uniref:Uncharacterized protein n=1 Tax=Brassica carinata TaxID=52824 RepID=A0A8X7W1J4_BRACI|nr:hypothetical protein Bca52824_014524 [Brassica carinata]
MASSSLPPNSQCLQSHVGKGWSLEIHNNPLRRSTIVAIPNDYLRSKILEKVSVCWRDNVPLLDGAPLTRLLPSSRLHQDLGPPNGCSS